MAAALELPVVRQVRRNHGLEHATVHMLAARLSGVRVSGLSDAGGFTLTIVGKGRVTVEMVERAARDALSQLRAGQRQLAIHPNCGTNLVTTGVVTSAVGYLTTRGMRHPRDLVERFPIIMFGMMGAVLASQPMGTWLQRNVTTDGDPADTEILSVTGRALNDGITLVRVNTRSS